MPSTSCSLRVGFAAVPSGMRNCPAQRSMLPSIGPPSDPANTLTTSSAAVVESPSPGTAYCSVRNCIVGACHVHVAGFGAVMPATSILFGSLSAVETAEGVAAFEGEFEGGFDGGFDGGAGGVGLLAEGGAGGDGAGTFAVTGVG